MKTGKISENILKRCVFKMCGEQRPDVLQGAGAGSDCAVMRAGQNGLFSCAVHPTPVDNFIKIRYSLEHAANNLACSGCLPAAAVLTVLLPPEAEESQLKEIMREAAKVCGELGISIAGGHTEVTASVTCPVLVTTALGTAGERLLTPAAARPGMELVAIGTIAREGTGLLASSGEAQLLARFPSALVEEAKKMGASIAVVREAQAAAKLGAAALHDASQGGIFGALWEMCEGAKLGMEADLRKIPIRQETVEVCEYFGKNPYCLASGGALLAAAEDETAAYRAAAHFGL